jgi:hypothetical protein
MFVATIVDPSQEDAPPQQMLFLPGSNQVIPMSAANGGLSSMMALANMPVVFNQNSSSQSDQSNTGAGLASSGGQASSNASGLSLQAQLLDSTLKDSQSQWAYTMQNQGLLSLNNITASSMDSGSQPQFDFASMTNMLAERQQQQMDKAASAPSPVFNRAPEAVAAAPTEDKASMPVRPLSAYNFFFSDERERILSGKTDDTFDNNKKQRLLLQHLAKDRSKRRPHRKTHGKINFTTLSKLIGQRWKQLPDERKNFYRDVASIDLERYQRELRERSPTAPASN